MKLLITMGMVAFLICFQLYGPDNKLNIFSTENVSDSITNDLNELLFYCRPALDEELDQKHFRNPSWTSSIVRTKSNKTFNVEGRYNLTNDDIQLLINNKPYILFGSKISAVILGREEFIHSTFLEDKREKEGYLKILVEGRRKLFSRNHKSNKGAFDTLFYTSINDEQPVRLNTKKKDLLKLLRDRKLSMYHYIQVNKLMPAEEKDLVQIFEHYNSL